jgi:hypothetical protein
MAMMAKNLLWSCARIVAPRPPINPQRPNHAHMLGGLRVSPLKTLFPEAMTPSQVEGAVRQAYGTCKRLRTQGSRVLAQGTSEGGLNVQMWINTETKTIETAYTVPKCTLNMTSGDQPP